MTDDGRRAMRGMTGVLAVVAHPDDESFGLGAVLADLIAGHVRATVLCFTRGEASALRPDPGELASVRVRELQAATAALGVERVELHRYPDGGLSRVPVDELAGHALRLIGEEHPSHVLVFDPVLHRRLELLADHEYLRLIHAPTRKGDKPMSYGMTVRLDAPFAPTVARVRAALADQGFGVLTEIDVRATLHQKIGAAMEDYLILGACNPPLAHRALEADRDIGLLLPCNVVVRADGPDATLVQALDPRVMTQVTGQAAVEDVADEAAARLRKALEALTG